MIICNSSKVVISSSKLANRLTNSTKSCNNQPVEVVLTSSNPGYPSILTNDIQNNSIQEEIQLNAGNTSSSKINIKVLPQDISYLPAYLRPDDVIIIPNGVLRVIKRSVKKQLLRQIHTDEDTAIELCLLYASKVRTYGVNLKAEYLQEYFSYNAKAYKKIRTALESNTSEGPIIVCNHVYKVGEASFYHTYHERFIGKGITTYTLKTKLAIRLQKKEIERIIQSTQEEKLVETIFNNYKYLSYPEYTLKQIREYIKKQKMNKKGQVFKSRFDSTIKPDDDVVYIEDTMDSYRTYITEGLMYPRAGSYESGGRVVDSIALMPSILRPLLRMNDEPVAILDYKCLHPNIVMMLYGGHTQYITHKDIARVANLPIEVVKTEHLAFFNKKPDQMRKSVLWEYYNRTEPELLQRLIVDKKAEGHNSTFRRIAEVEVKMLEDIIIPLKEKHNIPALYIYDAVMVPISAMELTLDLMNEVAEKYGVHTTAALA